MTRTAALFLALAAAAPARGAAPDPAEIQALDGAALHYFTDGNYSRAIREWQELLKLDPKHLNARRMVQGALAKIEERDALSRNEAFEHVRRGRYKKAAEIFKTLLAREEAHPRYILLSRRLERIVEIVGRAPRRKAWRKASLALTGFIGPKDDLRLAYNGLRYAIELREGDARLKQLLEIVTAEKPGLAEDKVPPGHTVLSHKRRAALEFIYDEKYAEAADALEQVLQLEPKDALALKRLGSVYYQLRRYADARTTWLKALAADPKDRHLKKYLKRAETLRGGDPPPP